MGGHQDHLTSFSFLTASRQVEPVNSDTHESSLKLHPFPFCAYPLHLILFHFPLFQVVIDTSIDTDIENINTITTSIIITNSAIQTGCDLNDK